jgi:hypothetical protein
MGLNFQNELATIKQEYSEVLFYVHYSFSRIILQHNFP